MTESKTNIPRSILCILAGMITVVVLSTLTDAILENTGIMKQPFELNPVGFIIFVILYRTLYGLLGSYITAALAPNRPMFHVMFGGTIGFLVAILGTISRWNIPPHWYPISLAVLALPTAWAGGKWRLARRSKKPAS